MSRLSDSLGMPIENSLPTSLLPTTGKREEESIEHIEEQSYNQLEVHNLAKDSLDFLAALAMPLTVSFGFPPVFQAVWKWLLSYIFQSRTFPKLALGLPRGFGKTTLIKVFLLFVILFTKRRFVLILCANARLAENIISDVCDMLDEPNIKKVFGDWRIGIEKDTQGLKKFGFRGRNIILAALGQGGSVRGLNLKNERPDVIVFDDIQTREDADSQAVSEGIEKWMFGTAMKAKAPTGCMYLFIANMYPTKWSLLRRLKKNPMWTKFIAGGILADGTSLWEELQPIEQLLEEFENDLSSGHPEIFYSEVLNDEDASVNTHIDLTKVPPYEYSLDEVDAGTFIVIDPSNDKANSDAVSIGLFKLIDARPVLWELEEGRFSPGETIRRALSLCAKYGCTLISVESNAYQYSLLYWFGFICQQLGISGIECVPIYSGSYSKNSRILSMFKELLSGDVMVAPDCRPAVWMQIAQFNALKRDNTDGLLDLLTYANKTIEEYGHFISITGALNAQDHDAVEVWDTADNCCF